MSWLSWFDLFLAVSYLQFWQHSCISLPLSLQIALDFAGQMPKNMSKLWSFIICSPALFCDFGVLRPAVWRMTFLIQISPVILRQISLLFFKNSLVFVCWAKGKIHYVFFLLNHTLILHVRGKVVTGIHSWQCSLFSNIS